MAISDKARRTILGVATGFGGILAFILFRWTPITGKGIFA